MSEALVRACCAALLLVGLGCESPPEDRCRSVPGGAGVELECESPSDGSWQDGALEEADEGMEQRGPGGRP